jgi:2-(1,2-epoxy-1,2-dihydrophenyl)acetyl-CoA isomerase
MEANAATANEPVLFEVTNGIARITLNRPHRANGVDLELAKALMSLALQCERDPSVRVVLLRGAGETFSAGGDLKDFVARGADLPAYLRDVTFHLHAAISRFAQMNAPVIAAVHGSAAGGGYSLALACDIVLAADSARFVSAYTKIGLVPDGGSTYTVPRLVGMRRAIELALLNRPLSADEALDWGLITRVVPDPELFRTADELAAQLAAGPTQAFGRTKRLLQGTWRESFESQMELESRAISELSATADGKEGIRAFVEKRTARFAGK